MATNPTRLLRKAYDYRNPLDIGGLVMGEAVIGELAQTRAFRRLEKIRFLGAIDYVLVRAPNQAKRRYTRFQHSLGVAELARRYGELADLSFEERRLVWVSALLHDLGHAPLSHSLEQVFLENFGIDHHSATRDIITGRVEIGQDVFDTLKRHGINIERLLAVIDGHETSFNEFFSGPINFDTVEGILRTIRYVRASPSATHPKTVIQAATARVDATDCEIVDGFWRQKDFVYREIINSHFGIVADTISQIFMKNNISKFSKDDFFGTEEGFFLKLPNLKNALLGYDTVEKIENTIDWPIIYNRRNFFVDRAYDFRSRQDTHRYRQNKIRAALLPRHARLTYRTDLNRDFFDDDTI